MAVLYLVNSFSLIFSAFIVSINSSVMRSDREITDMISYFSAGGTTTDRMEACSSEQNPPSLFWFCCALLA